MTETWISLDDAQDRVNKLTNTYLGKERILDALAKGQIRAKAGTFVERVPGQPPNYKPNELLPPEFWARAEVSPYPNGGVARQHTHIGKDEFDRDQWTTCEAHDIHLLMEDLVKCWPDLPLSDPAQPPDLPPQPTVRTIKKDKGGRPTKHDWIKAAAYAAAHYIDHDSEPKLRKALKDWFEANFQDQPDNREVERFARDFVQEFKNLKRPIQ